MYTKTGERDRLELETHGLNLVRHLGGQWHGGSGLCLCPAHADRSPSLSVRVGDSDLLFKCFAGCDTIDVLRAIARLGPVPHYATPQTLPRSWRSSDSWLRGRAQALWSDAHDIAGTPVERYLTNRAIHRPACGLRYHPRTPLGPTGKVVFRPALIAAVREGSEIVAVQRTFLDAKLARRSRDLPNARRMLGRPRRGAVYLADATDTLGLAEGIETALSAIILLGIPVWAVLGNERLPLVDVPASVERLVLLADNDRPGRRSAEHAREAHSRSGRTIETLWPWRGLNDWNDVLRQEEKGGGERVRQAA